MILQYRRQLPEFLISLNMLGDGVEVGVAEGNFSADLLREGIPRLYMVDIWNQMKKAKGDASNPQRWHDDNYHKAKLQTKPFGDRAIFLQGFSADMAGLVPDNSLSLVYLDGDHSYNGVWTDLVAWFPKLKVGGVLAGHDFLAPEYGVKQAVEDFCRSRFEVHVIPEDKNEDAGFYFLKTQ